MHVYPRSRHLSAVSIALAAILLWTPSASAQVSVDVVVEVGDTIYMTETISALRSPFVNGLGQVGFGGDMAGGEDFVWIDAAPVFRNSDVTTHTLIGGETSMGISDGGDFIVSPSVDGDDAVWTSNGLLAVENVQAQGLPAGTNLTFASRPRMAANGAAYFISGTNASGGTASEGRALFTTPTGLPADLTPVIQTGDMIGGETVEAPSGIDFDFGVSQNGAHVINIVTMDVPSTLNDQRLLVDLVVVASEDSPNGSGDNWDNFDLVSVNNSGNYVFSGDTDGPTTSDEFVAYNGTIVVREGDTIDGLTLTSSATLRFLAINDDGVVVHAWGILGGGEHIFVTCDPTNFAASTTRVLSTGDALDIDGDGMADGLTLDDLNASTAVPWAGLTRTTVFAEVDLDDGMVSTEAIIGIPLGCSTCGDGTIEAGEDCDDSGESTTCDADCTFVSCGDNTINMTAGEACDDGGMNSDTAPDACRTTCVLPSCGDSVIDTMEICDDGMMNSDTAPDACRTTCVPAGCGDSVIDMMEGCDDGMMNSDTAPDACRTNCALATCGDGVLDMGEACDDGAMMNSDTEPDACRTTCVAALCGDSVLDTGEACDDGNTDDTDTCTNACTMAVCGDGSVLDGVEECDDGMANSDSDADACRTNCSAATCGDSVVDTGEECDEGMANGGASCSDTCRAVMVTMDDPDMMEGGSDVMDPGTMDPGTMDPGTDGIGGDMVLEDDGTGGSKEGCGCRVARRPTNAAPWGAALTLMAGFGALLLGRRRRRQVGIALTPGERRPGIRNR